jgi:exodeoxyribonuclease VII small subunit
MNDDPELSSLSQIPIDQLTFEQAMQDLEKTIALMESSEPTLEEAIALFERGQALARHCVKLLDQAELKIQAIVENQLTPFKPPEG